PSRAITIAQYVVLQVLLFHRGQRQFDAFQREHKWRQRLMARGTKDTRIGILGLGYLGGFTAQRLTDLGFPVSGWSRSPKAIEGVASFTGADGLNAILRQSDILICLLPLTEDTRDILDAKAFASMPEGAFLIQAGRGEHL